MPLSCNRGAQRQRAAEARHEKRARDSRDEAPQPAGRRGNACREGVGALHSKELPPENEKPVFFGKTRKRRPTARVSGNLGDPCGAPDFRAAYLWFCVLRLLCLPRNKEPRRFPSDATLFFISPLLAGFLLKIASSGRVLDSNKMREPSALLLGKTCFEAGPRCTSRADWSTK